MLTNPRKDYNRRAGHKTRNYIIVVKFLIDWLYSWKTITFQKYFCHMIYCFPVITGQLIISTTVKPQYNKVPRDWQNLWKKPRFSDVKVLFHIIYYYWGRQKLSFVISRTLLIEVCYIEVSLAWSLNLKTRKFFTQLQRYHCFWMLWEVNFYFQLLCMHVLTFWGKRLGGRHAAFPNPPPPAPRACISSFVLNKVLKLRVSS